jgi:CDP-glucose 4,6-dehydratase
VAQWKGTVENLVAFWRNKKVFITGHTGFKGSWLSLWLQHLGAEIAGYALDPPTKTNLFTETKIAKNMHDVRADIRDYQTLATTLKNFNPDIIFHLAAQPLVRYSYANPIETYATNVMGTVNLLEAARQCANVRAIVNVTTDKCYENREWFWGYREEEPLGGRDPYSNSKACSELVTSAYRDSFFQKDSQVGLASARAGNVIGGGDWAQDRLVPDIITACVANSPIKIRYPHAIRPWQHVLDPLNGYLRLAEQLYHHPKKFSEAWNFGPAEHDAKSVAAITDIILQLWKHPTSWQSDEKNHPHEANFLKLDCAKAHSKLNWKIRWNIDDALNATVNWYQAFYQGNDTRQFSLQQIEHFMKGSFK